MAILCHRPVAMPLPLNMMTLIDGQMMLVVGSWRSLLIVLRDRAAGVFPWRPGHFPQECFHVADVPRSTEGSWQRGGRGNGTLEIKDILCGRTG